jgi:hypothetical protein
MPCEKYQAALIELAASGAEPDRDLRAHLDTCVSCAELVRQERLLLASIDSGLRRIANVETPATLQPRILAGLAEETRAEGARNLARIGGFAAAAVLAVLLLAFLWPRDVKEAVTPPGTQPVPAERKESSAPQRRQPHDIAARGVTRMSQRNAKGATVVAGKSEPEVLIPPEEREAFAHFVSSVEERKDLALALVNPAPEKKTEFLDVEPLRIARLEMKPLEEEGSPGDAEPHVE